MLIVRLIAVLILILTLFPGSARAQALNLRGGIDVTYGQNQLVTESAQTDSWSLLHRYNLGTSGVIWDPRMGIYNADISFQEDLGKTEGTSNRDQDILDYRVSVNLLPRRTPLTLLAQRVTRDNKLLLSNSSNQLETYSLTLDLPLKKFPHLRFNLFQTNSTTLPSDFETVQTRTASVEVNHRFSETHLFSRYQYSERESAITPRSSAHNIKVNSESRLDPATTLHIQGNYSSQATTLGTVNPLLSTFQQRNAGISLFHQPSLELTSRLSYDYFRDPFERHLLRGSTRYRVSQKMDLSGSYRYLRFNLSPAISQSHLANVSLNYRPILGMSTGANMLFVTTDVKSESNIRVDSQNYSAFVNYFKRYDRVTLNTGYHGSIFRTVPDPGERTMDFINTLRFGITNSDTRWASLGGSYYYSYIYRLKGSDEKERINQHSFNLHAQSSGIRNLMLRGDMLSVNAKATFVYFDVVDGTDRSVQTSEAVTYDTLRGIVFSTGHQYDDMATSTRERHMLFGKAQWVTFLRRNLHLTASAKESVQMYDQRENVVLFEGHASLIYTLGRVTFSLNYHYTDQYQDETKFATQSFFVRASRTLF